MEAREPRTQYLVATEPALLHAFDLFATAPGAATTLRSLILSLAVQGKLVQQETSDASASELLAQIRAELDLQETTTEPVSPDGAMPFDIPSSWEWVSLGEVVDLIRGITFPASEKTNEPAPNRIACLRTTNVQHSIEWHDLLFVDRSFMGREVQLIRHHDIVMSMANSRELVGKVALIESVPYPEATFGGFLGVLRPRHIDPRYVMAALRTDYARRALIGSASQTTNIANISLGKLRPLPFPLPPLAEQHRIVARVEELMKLCDALEQSGRLADEQHARLTSTLFDALAISESAQALAENWQRVAEHFDVLLDRPEAVDALEQAIAQLAVRGLLVPQAASDEPADALLQRLRARRPPLKGRTSSQPAAVEVPAAPYELPNEWSWAALDELVENMGSGWSPACDEGERSDPHRWAVLRTTSVQVMEYRPREHKAIPQRLNPRPNIEVQVGDILITRAGPLNRVGISCWVDETPPRLMLSDKIVRFHPTVDEMLPAFIVLALNAGWTRDQLEAAKTGMAASQVNISQADLRRIVLPVCSKAEQRRIVERVNELRCLCTELRQRVTQSRATQSRLADALVAKVT